MRHLLRAHRRWATRAIGLLYTVGLTGVANWLLFALSPPISGGADTQYGTGATEAVKRWAAVLMVELPREIYFAKWMKENDQNAIIEVKRDLQKQAGDRITFTLLRKLTGAGVSGDDTLEGNEESLVTYSDNVTIDQRRNAVRLKGRMTERRVAFSLRLSAKNQLRTWMAETIDDDIFNGFATGTVADRIVYGGNATATANVGSDDGITTALMDKLIAKAKKADPKIWPVRVEGLDLFVLLLHTDVSYDLRQLSTWYTAQQNANIRGRDNPQFLGALGFWGGQLVIHEHEKVPVATDWGSTGDVPGASNLFLGRQAGVFAWGATPEAWEKEFDYGNKVGFAVGAIWGFKKAIFNNVDHGYIEVRTYRTNN